jgi:pimeloyl-ACP methyl ester carboxylesterase
MNKTSFLPDLPWVDLSQSEFARRVSLAAEPEAEPARRPKLRRALGELEYCLEPFRRPFRTFDIATTSDPKIVLILPGFATRANKMRYMAEQIEKAGHRTKRWGLGFNWGADSKAMDLLEERLAEICDRYKRNVVLLGWSMGGLYARELAKRQPDCIDKVITLGAPFSGSPRANNVWRLYQAVAGHSVDAPPLEIDRPAKPPVETVAMWSPLDGAIDPRSAAGQPGERDRAIALRCTHCGFTYSRDAIHAVIEELDRPL